MDTKLATRQIRIQQWTAIIRDRKASGLRVDDYCQQHDISRNAYFYWLRKVKEAALDSSGFSEYKPLSNDSVRNDSPRLIADINGIHVGICDGASMDLFSEIVQVLKNA